MITRKKVYGSHTPNPGPNTTAMKENRIKIYECNQANFTNVRLDDWNILLKFNFHSFGDFEVSLPIKVDSNR